MNILVLCTGNSCRSQMMHGFLQQMLGARANVYSAGIETHGLNPRAVKVMAEAGIDISGHTSNHVDEYRDIPFDYVITVCDHAHEHCPWFPSKAIILHHNFSDPAKVPGDDEAVMPLFRRTREEIRQWCEAFVNSH
jgi:arsenate reductase